MSPKRKFSYVKDKWIGEGGMAVVYRYRRFEVDENGKRDEGSMCYVAVKHIKPSLRHHAKLVEAFDKECDNLRDITSAHVVHMYGFEDDIDGFKCIVMEWVDGCTLTQLFDSTLHNPLLAGSEGSPFRFSATTVTRFARELLSGLKDIHFYEGPDRTIRTVVHRDVNPHNVLVSKTGKVKIADFGISSKGSKPWFVTTGIAGNPGFMAPEWWTQSSEKKYDQSVDLYGAGLILFEMMCGRCYVGWEDGASPERKHALVRPYLLEHACAHLEIVELVVDLLQPVVDRRIRSATAALERIKTIRVSDHPEPEFLNLVERAMACSPGHTRALGTVKSMSSDEKPAPSDSRFLAQGQRGDEASRASVSTQGGMAYASEFVCVPGQGMSEKNTSVRLTQGVQGNQATRPRSDALERTSSTQVQRPQPPSTHGLRVTEVDVETNPIASPTGADWVSAVINVTQESTPRAADSSRGRGSSQFGRSRLLVAAGILCTSVLLLVFGRGSGAMLRGWPPGQDTPASSVSLSGGAALTPPIALHDSMRSVASVVSSSADEILARVSRELEQEIEVGLLQVAMDEQEVPDLPTEALTNQLAIYLQLTQTELRSGAASAPAFRCKIEDPRHDLPKRQGQICGQVRKRLMEAAGAPFSRLEHALDERLGQRPGNAQLVSRALKTLLPQWEANMLKQLNARLTSSAPGAPGSTRRRDALKRLRALGLAFHGDLPEYFGSDAWLEYLRETICELERERDSIGVEHVLDSSQVRRIAPRDRFFERYDEAWFRWLSSMHWAPGRKFGVNTQALAALRDEGRQPIADLRRFVRHEGTIRSATCDSERADSEFTMPFLAQLDEIVGDEGLEQQLSEFQTLLASCLANRGASEKKTRDQLGRLATLRGRIDRSFEGRRKLMFEAIEGVVRQMEDWANAELVAQSRPTSAVSSLPELWCRKIQGPFVKRFGNRYPFRREARKAAGLKEVRAFFHPKTGSLWKHVLLLSNHIVQEGNQFRAKEGPPGSPKLGAQALLFLRQAWAFSNALYPDAARTESLRFEFTMLPGRDVRSASIDLSATKLRLENGVAGRRKLLWPTETRGMASLAGVAASNADHQVSIAGNKGAWSLFWLLEQGRVVSDSKSGVRLAWKNKETSSPVVEAEVRVLGPSSLFFGPSWFETLFLKVLRISVPPGNPFSGSERVGCARWR